MRQVAVMMLHPNCNMTCSFCINEETMGTFSANEARAFARERKAEGFKTLVLGGGEPLTWPHGFWEFTQYAHDLGLLTQIGTNGILLPEGFEKIPSADRFVIPLDGTSLEIHNAVRLWRGRHHAIIVDRLKKLAAAKKSTTVSTVVTKINQYHIRKIGEFLKSLDESSNFIHAWHLYYFIPEGRGGAVHRDELILSNEEYSKAVETITDLNLRFKVFRRPDMMHSKTVEFFWAENDKIIGQLGAERRYLEKELIYENI